MKNVIAIDIGGTTVRVAIVDANFEIIKVDKTSTVIGNKDVFLNQVKESIDRLEPNLEEIVSIAIGVPGVIERNGMIKFLPNIKIQDIPLKAFLETTYHLPVTLLNDAEMAAIGEGNLGGGRGKKSSFYVTISTGLGGAFINDGRLKKVNNEIGHTLFPSDEGFVEMENRVSGSGIPHLAAFYHLPITSAQDFFKLVSHKDKNVLPMYNAWKKMLGDFFTFLTNAYAPEIIIIGGGLLKSKHLFFNELQKLSPTPLVLTSFGDDAGLLGAAYCAFNYRLFQ